MFSELMNGLRQFTDNLLEEQSSKDIDFLHSGITSNTSKGFFSDLLIDSFIEHDKMVLIFQSGKIRTYSRGAKAVVTHIIDGDTIVIKFSDNISVKVRLLGIDCPEIQKPGVTNTPLLPGKSFCYGEQAQFKTRKILTERTVFINFDLNTIDQYNRLLLMVYFTREAAVEQSNTPIIVQKTFNYQLVREGYARSCFYDDNPTFKEQFNQAQQIAKEESKGAWGFCERPFES
jgi:micrococcal nuclease